MLRTYPRRGEDEGHLFWELHKIMEIICSSASVLPQVLCMYIFVFKSFPLFIILCIGFLPARVVAN